MEDHVSFGYWLQKRRKALDLTQAELARRAGCSAATIRKIEADERRPSKQLAELLAQQLQLPAEQHEGFIHFARGIRSRSRSALELPLVGSEPEVPDLTGETAEASAASGQLHNLPPQATPFVGRGEELAQLARFIADPAVRLVSILGPGGMGKTRLALAAAEGQLRKSQQFPHGVYFVPLAGVESADFVAQTIAEAIGLQFGSGDDPRDQLLRYLKKRNMLLILDNFEHLLPGIALVERLVQEAPQIQMLVTSREKLNLQAEQLFPIGGLRYPRAAETAAEIEGFSAVQLFMQCAGRVRPQFRLTPDNQSAVAAICRLVQGMPLGIVLAASWIDALSPGEIAAEIGRDLDFLALEMSDVPQRQRSLQAAFNHSWRLVGDRERAIYGQLSVFRGGFTGEAAAAVAGASPHDLQNLVNKSMQTRVSARGAYASRYEIHELLRQFAARELAAEAGEETAVRDRHSVYYCNLLAEQEDGWRSAEQLQTLAAISRESDNIAAAWRAALETKAWPRLAAAADSWGQYHMWQGLYADGWAIFKEVEACLLAWAGGDIGGAGKFVGLLAKSLAWQAVFNSDTDEALQTLEQGLALLEDGLVDPDERLQMKAFALRQIAWRLMPVDVQRAGRAAREALSVCEALGDRWQVAECHTYLGLVGLFEAQIGAARAHTEAALSLFADIGDRRMQVLPTIVMGWILQFEGDLDGAERLRYEVMRLCRQVGDQIYLIYCYTDLAITLTFQGQLEKAQVYGEKGVALSQERGLRDREGLARDYLSMALLHQGNYAQAREELETALLLVQDTGNRDIEADVLMLLGLLALAGSAGLDEPHKLLHSSLLVEKETHGIASRGTALTGLGIAACKQGDMPLARRYLAESRRLLMQTRSFVHLLELIPALALVSTLDGDPARGLEVWELACTTRYVAASRWFDQVIGQEIRERTAVLTAEEIKTAVTRGRAGDLWQTAESLLAELG